MGKRGGLKTKINKGIAHVKWLLYTKTPSPAWLTAQKLQSQLDCLKASLEEIKPITTAHSAKIKVINNNIKTKPHSSKPLPKKPDVCPND